MADYLILPEAQADMKTVWDYIAEDNPIAADRTSDRFYDAFHKLVEFPHMGHKREDLTRRPVRFWAVQSYLIIYKPDAKPLEILRILSGYRDITGIL